MKNIIQKVKSLCLPSKIYFYVSLLSILALFIQNCGNQNMYCLGLFKTRTIIPNSIYFIFKLAYILGWTWLLNYLCTKGYKKFSWFLVLLPFIAMFILMGLLFISLKNSV